MAIYRLGEAELKANGQVIGKGTNWQDQLALIRVGATIVFLSGSSPVLATISAIKSPTELTVIENDKQIAAMGKYVILLHDSITVEGLAQDVAETLRYYQSQETEIADAVDYFRTFDWVRFEKIATQVKTDAAQSKQNAANAKVSETNSKTSETNSAANAKTATDKAAESKANADSAAASKAAAARSETNSRDLAAAASLSAQAAKQSEGKAAADAATSSKAAADALASQLASKTSETNSATSASQAKASQDQSGKNALAAAGSASNAKTSETNSAKNAATSTAEADRAKREADRAAASNPDNALLKANNLSDVADKAKTRENLSLSRHKESSIETIIESSDINKKLYLSAPNDTWGFYDYATKKHIALPVGAGGTGATDAAGSRKNLSVPSVEEIGVSVAGNIQSPDANNIRYNGFFAGAGNDSKNYARPYGPGIVLRRTNDVYQIQPDTEGHLHIRSYTNATWSNWVRNIIPGDYGIGVAATTKPGSDWGSMFISDANGSTDWAPTNGAGIQSSYANNRGAQIWVDNTGRLHSRFNMTSSPQATKAASPWKRTLNDDDIGANVERAGGNLGTIGLGDASLRGNGHGVYYQPASANATPERGYPTHQAGSFRVEQNGANGANGCVQFYTPYTGIGGTYFRFVAPDGSNLVPGGPAGWKMNLTNNGDVCGGNAPTISDYNNFASNHVGFGYGTNVANSTGTGGVVNTISNTKFADYKSMSCHDYASGRLFFRTFNADSVKSWTPWKEVTFLAASDINLKEVKGNLNLNGALDNVCRMDFKLFRYLSDTPDRSARRGVIAQQIQKIDREYVKQVGDYLHLDQTPLLLDGLAAIKALKVKNDGMKAEIEGLKGEIGELKEMIQALIAK